MLKESIINGDDAGSLTGQTLEYDVFYAHLLNLLAELWPAVVVLLGHGFDEAFCLAGVNQTDGAASPPGSSQTTPKGSIHPGQLGDLVDFRAGALVEVAAGCLALVH